MDAEQGQKSFGDILATKQLFFEKFKSVVALLPDTIESKNLKVFEKLVRDCAYSNRAELYKELEKLEESKRISFLENFFKSTSGNRENEADIKNKATLVSSMLGSDKFISTPALKKILDLSLPRSGWIYNSRPYGYAEINQKLEEQRIEALKRDEEVLFKEIDGVLQKGYQAELEGKFSSLREGSLKALEDLKGFFEKAAKVYEDEDDDKNPRETFLAKHLRDFKFPDNVTSDEKVRKLMDSITARNQLIDIVEIELPTKETLEKFIEVYKKMNKEHLDFLTDPPINLKKLQDLLRVDICSDDKNVTYTQMRKLAEEGDKDQHCISLLKLCFKEDGEVQALNKASLVYSMIAAKGEHIFSGDKATSEYAPYLRYVLSWPRYTFTRIITFGLTKDARAYTSGEIRKKLEDDLKATAGDAGKSAALKEILQSALQKRLENQYQCLQVKNADDFKKLKQELDSNSDLISFEFNKELDPKVKAYIENIVKRNQLADIIKNGSIDEETFKNFIVVYNSMAQGYLREPPLNLRKLQQIIKFGVVDRVTNKTECKQLRDLSEQKRSELLAFYFKGEADGAEKAFIVSRMIGNEEFFKEGNIQLSKIREDLLRGAFIGITYVYSYAQLKEALETIRLDVKTEAKIAKQIERVLQGALQDELESKYKSQMFEGWEVVSENLKAELRGNYDLRSFDFQNEKYSQATAVKSYIQYICNRNRVYDLVAKHKKGQKLTKEELGNFIEACAGFKDSNDLRNAFDDLKKNKGIKPGDVLDTIRGDIGTNSATWAVTSFRCDELRKMEEEKRKALLAYCFGPFEKTPDAAKKKAKLISELLKSEELFNPKRINDPVVQKIIYNIYWSMVPGKLGKIYDFNFLQTELGKLSGKLKEGDALKEVIDDAISSLEKEEVLVSEEKEVLGPAEAVTAAKEEAKEEDDDDDEYYDFER